MLTPTAPAFCTYPRSSRRSVSTCVLPATATADQLHAYNYPPRPSDPGERADWERTYGAARHAAPTPFIIGVPRDHAGLTGGGGSSPCSTLHWCWGGYYASGATFTQSYIDYYEPTEALTLCNSDEVATWTGIGGTTGLTLAQTGTLPHIGGGTPDHQMFWQVWPTESSVQLFIDTAPAGHDVQATVRWDGTNHGWWFIVYDSTALVQDSTFDAINSHDFSTAEWIVERPQTSATIWPLRNFSTWTTNSDQANSIGMQNYSLTPLGITNKSGTTLETTGSRTTDHFSATWNKCG